MGSDTLRDWRIGLEGATGRARGRRAGSRVRHPFISRRSPSVARRRRPKQEPHSAAHTLNALETRGDRAAEWISENPLLILGVGGVILLVAAIWGFSSQDDREEDLQASAELSVVENDYRTAMGAAAGSVEIPEPANPEAARSIREDFVAQFSQLGAGASGTVAGALAQLEAGKLEQQLGHLESAETLFRAGAEALPPAGEGLAAFFLVRLASAHEAASEWPEAARTYLRASQVPDYPLSQAAVADAIRCYLEAGDLEAARSLLPSLERDGANAAIPNYVSARFDEIRYSGNTP